MGTLGKITEGIDGQLEVNYIDKWGERLRVKAGKPGEGMLISTNSIVTHVYLPMCAIESLRDHLTWYLETGSIAPPKSDDERVAEWVDSLPWVNEILSTKLQAKVKSNLCLNAYLRKNVLTRSTPAEMVRDWLHRQSLSGGVSDGFLWPETPEGQEYWSIFHTGVSGEALRAVLSTPTAWDAFGAYLSQFDKSTGVE